MELQMNGIDISQYQGNIDWGKVSEDDVDFAFVRSTIVTRAYEKNKYQDWKFQQNWRNARENSNLALGVYHVFVATASVDKQLAVIDESLEDKVLDMPIAIDIERYWNVPTREEHTELMINFLSAFEMNFEKPIIYTGAWFWNRWVVDGDWSRYPLWTAAYTQNPIMPKGWTEWDFWQYSSSGSVDGVPGGCDMNYGKFKFDDYEEIDVEVTDLVPVRNGLGVDSLQTDVLEPGAQLKSRRCGLKLNLVSGVSWTAILKRFNLYFSAAYAFALSRQAKLSSCQLESIYGNASRRSKSTVSEGPAAPFVKS